MLVNLPFWRKLVVDLKQEFGWKLGFDVLDLFRAFSNRSPTTEVDEKILIQESDLVLASSSILFDLAKKEGKSPVLLHNATEFEHFHRAVSPIEWNEMRNYRHPIIGSVSYTHLDVYKRQPTSRPSLTYSMAK